MTYRFAATGRRWFDGVTTYHTWIVAGIEDPSFWLASPKPIYGYGEHWRDTLIEALREKGIQVETREVLFLPAADVGRKKDL